MCPFDQNNQQMYQQYICWGARAAASSKSKQRPRHPQRCATRIYTSPAACHLHTA